MIDLYKSIVKVWECEGAFLIMSLFCSIPDLGSSNHPLPQEILKNGAMLRNTFGKYLVDVIYSKYSKTIYFEAFTWQFQNRMSYSDVHAKPELIKTNVF